ncbi:hypothetical protein B566_EDAN009672 [Ephemera danica]|nr:hypothetical protein B566_EDAN009672 [Ephemera danica]
MAEGARGALFSLSSRRQPDAYLSLELAGGDSLRLVHSNRGVSRSVNIPARVADGNWHWLALSTELLPHNALDTPTDADLVVGYLFQVIPLDTAINSALEWTPWSICNATCNDMGVQTRQSRCVDRPSRDPAELELCIESGGEVTQSRECMGTCHKTRCHCLNGGICHKKHHCHCPPEFMGRKCQLKRPNKNNLVYNCTCLHGSCINHKCICFKGYKGVKCDMVNVSARKGSQDRHAPNQDVKHLVRMVGHVWAPIDVSVMPRGWRPFETSVIPAQVHPFGSHRLPLTLRAPGDVSFHACVARLAHHPHNAFFWQARRSENRVRS